MSSSYIYKITNKLNNKIYIGKSKNPLQRFASHIKIAEKPYYAEKFSAIHGAIKKYGKESFLFEIIEVCDTLVVNEREIYWIKSLNANKKESGYNLTIGGDGVSNPSEQSRQKRIKTITGRKLSEEHKKNISKGNTGKHHTEATIQKLSNDRMGVGNPMYGKTASPEAREKQSKFQSERIRQPLTDKHKQKLSQATVQQDRKFRIPLEVKKQIVSDYATNKYTKKQLSEKFGLKFNTIVKIIRSFKN